MIQKEKVPRALPKNRDGKLSAGDCIYTRTEKEYLISRNLKTCSKKIRNGILENPSNVQVQGVTLKSLKITIH